MYNKAAKKDNKQMVSEPESLKVGSPVDNRNLIYYNLIFVLITFSQF